MANRWRQNEIQVLENHLADHPGEVLTDEIYERLAGQLQGRSTAAVKKKILEIRRPDPRARQAAALWTGEEERRLVSKYRETQAENKTERIRLILEEFPGRTLKAIRNKLLERAPEIYYGQPVVPDRRRQEEPEENPRERVEDPEEIPRREPANPRRDEEDHPEAQPPQNPRLWTPEEVRRLAIRYVESIGTTKTARLETIVAEFPGRSTSALGSKLRKTYPGIYNGTEGIPEEWRRDPGPEPEDPRPEPEPVLDPDPNLGPQRAPDVNPDPPDGDQDGPERTERDVGETAAAPEPQEDQRENDQEEAPRNQVRATRDPPRWACDKLKALQETLGRKTDLPKLKRICGKINRRILGDVDGALREALAQIATTGDPAETKRRRAKVAILAAGILLEKETRKGHHAQGPPRHILTERKINKLKRHVALAKELQAWRGKGLPNRLKTEARLIRAARMTPHQYIVTNRDRITVLEGKLEYQRKKAKAAKTRCEFIQKPSMRTIEQKRSTTGPELRATENHFREVFKADTGPRQPSPVFNAFIDKMRRHRETVYLEDQLDQVNIQAEITAALRGTAPWKAAGEDAIPAALYKIFGSARKFLGDFITSTLQGERPLSEPDARARVVLIHKTGDPTKPENYRPIAVLNTDYKLLTAVITALVRKELPDWAIPKEQLAREGVWGTMHGGLLDKAYTQDARVCRRPNWSAWYDFEKAYDSVQHGQLRRLIEVLPVHRKITDTLKKLTRTWSVRVQVGKERTRPIYVRRGVFQGDTVSPLLFLLMTSSITEEVKTNPGINRESRGRHGVLAFMDDIKCHAPSERAINLITRTLRDAAQEIGLKLNIKKCGIYSREQQRDLEEEEEGPPEEDGNQFLPAVRQGYKYLGLDQLERDTQLNHEKVATRTIEEAEKIFDSELTPTQKVRLFNSTLVPAAIYVLGNLYPDESRATTLRKSRDLDKDIRKLLVRKGLKGRTTATAGTYLPVGKGGLGLKSLELEVEAQYVRKGMYLRLHPDLQDARNRYDRLRRAGWRNPISDAEFILEKYEVTPQEHEADTDISAYCRRTAQAVFQKQIAILEEQWSRNMSYGRIVARERNNISFPAHDSIHIEDWQVCILQSAAEEQLHGAGGIPGRQRPCRSGCGANETAYHIVSACPTPLYNNRHDLVVWWILRYILQATGAPEETMRELPFGKATITADYNWGERQVKMRSGVKLFTEAPLKHNKPDIHLILENPREAFVLEVAIAHVQNLRAQERLKRARYTINSIDPITWNNVDEVPRNANLVGELQRAYRCPVHMGVLVLGVFGETIETAEKTKTTNILNQLGIPPWRSAKLIEKCCFSVAASTADILIRRLKEEC